MPSSNRVIAFFIAKPILLEELADATLDGKRKEHVELIDRIATDHRRSRHAQTSSNCRRRAALNHHAPLQRASSLLTPIVLSKTGVSCSATARPSPLCSTACCITAMCSSAAHAAGDQNRQRGRNAMITANAKPKTIMMPGKERPAASQTRFQTPLPEPHHRNLRKDTNPPPPTMTEQERVVSTDSCGASPGKSALDRSARRDPGGRLQISMRGVRRATGRLAQTHAAR